MRRLTVISLVSAALLLPATAASANHVPPTLHPHFGLPADVPLLREGDIRFVSNLGVMRGVAAPLDQGGPFTRDGRRYLVGSSSIYGLHVVDITDPLKPVGVSDYASAFGCPQQAAEYTAGWAQSEERDPFSLSFGLALGSFSGWENDFAATNDGRIGVLGMDAPGRCHDPYAGGLELVDLTDFENPRTLHLTRNVGDSHSVTVDPKRPWLAYVSTSDENDFIDIVDFRSCLGGVDKLDACRPAVARAVFDPAYMPGIPVDPDDPKRDVVGEGCHDIRFRGDRAYCAAIDTTLILDVSKVVGSDGELTGTHLTEGKDACTLVDATRAPGIKVTDCYNWSMDAFRKAGAKAVEMRAVSVIRHDGSKPPDQDISIAHQAEAIEGGAIMMITDERGGGLGAGPHIGPYDVPGHGLDLCDPSGRCLPGRDARAFETADGTCPGGGVSFYDIRDEAHPKRMRFPNGDPAIFITENFVDSPASCTVHYGTQFGNERLLTFAWYTGGTHVIRYEPDFSQSPSVLTLDEVASYVPLAAWTIQAFPLARNPDDPGEVLVYTADASRGMDVFAVKVAPSGPGSGPTILGGHRERALPRTGLADPAIVALALLTLAVGLGRRLRHTS